MINGIMNGTPESDKELYEKIETYKNAYRIMSDAFENEVRKNKRPTGEWLWLGFDDGDSRKWSCSFCGRGVVNQENFCPNCGADMRSNDDVSMN